MNQLSGAGGNLGPMTFRDAFNPEQEDECLNNMRENAKWGFPTVKMTPPHHQTMVIVGGGPSLKANLDYLRHLPKTHKIFCVNDVHDYLIEEGITPWAFGIMEVAPWSREFLIHAKRGIRYYLASMCHPTMFERLKKLNVIVWHAQSDIGEEPIIREDYGDWIIIPGAEAMSVRAVNLGMTLGFRNFEMVGVDSSFEDRSHVYMDNDHLETVTVTCNGRDFKTKAYLARQADDFRRFLGSCGHMFKLKCHGDGLIQHIHRSLYPEIYE